MLLQELVSTSAAVAAISARGEKTALLAACIRRLQPAEAAVGVAYLSGQLRQRQIGVGYASIRDLPPPAAEPTLTLLEVDSVLETVGLQAGHDSQSQRRQQLSDLFG